MSGTEIAAVAAPALPAHIAKFFPSSAGVINNDLSAGVSGSFPSLSLKGKVWHIVQGGSRELVTNDDGEPRSSLEVAIIKANPNISKVWYASGYTEGSEEKPDCSSHNGVVPDAGSPTPQALKCAVCPHNQWGSRITENGAKGKACSDFRRLAVAPVDDLENPMLLRVPAGSLRELVDYAGMLARRNTPYQAVVTKVGFDHTVAHQKLVFKAARWLDADQVAVVADVMQRDIVERIIGAEEQSGGAPAAAAPAIDPEDDPEAIFRTPQPTAAAPTPAAAAPKPPKAAPKPKPAQVIEAEVATILAEPAPVAAAPVVEEEDDEEAAALAALAAIKAKKAAAAAAAAAQAPTPAEVATAKKNVLLQEADQTLESVLRNLDFDD